MEKSNHEKIHKVNCLSNDLEAVYHQAALKFGMSDSVMFVLYMIYYKGDHCLLYDICKETGISKQTINSAIRKLEADEILYLEQYKGKAKQVCLTEKGKDYINRTVARLYKAECDVFDAWTEEEFSTYLKLMEKYNSSLSAQLEKM